MALFCYFGPRGCFGPLSFFGLRRLSVAPRLELTEFGGAAVENAVGLSAGAVDSDLDSFGDFADGLHGVVNRRVTDKYRTELGLNACAAAEAPHGAMDFIDEALFEDIGRCEAAVEFGAKLVVIALFAGANEAAGEEIVFEGGHRDPFWCEDTGGVKGFRRLLNKVY